jgi:membrane protease YdiL (CAAX protease family)
MSTRTISGYLAIIILSFLLYSIKPKNNIFYSSLPILMVMFPIIVGYRVKLKFSIKDFFLGLIVSLIILLPYYLVFGGNLKTSTAYYIIFQLLSVSLPEEFFFRGFLQDSIGRNFRAVLLVSLLFSIAHLPRAIFFNEWISLLSFFPSIVMGWLYMKTNNILPGTIFHLLANLVYYNASL